MQFAVRRARFGDAEAIARVHVTSWEETYRGLLADDEIDRRPFVVRFDQWSSRLRDEEIVTFVAADGDDTVVGFVSAELPGPHPFDAYLRSLYIVHRAHGFGIGRALLAELAAALDERGAKSVALHVLAGNPACGFYERLQARRVDADAVAVEGAERFRVAYGWSDLAVLR